MPLLVRAPAPALRVVLRLAQEASSDLQLLQDRLGFTAAEVAVATGLAEGATIAEIADARGVSRLTVRDQVRRSMQKVAARRQSDLIRQVVELRRRR